jgi:hypothetical protein
MVFVTSYCAIYKQIWYVQITDCQMQHLLTLPGSQNIQNYYFTHRFIRVWNLVSHFSLWHFSQRRLGFSPRVVCMGFVGDKTVLGQIFLRVLRFSPVNIIPPLLHIHSCIILGLDNGSVRGRSSFQTVSPHRNNKRSNSLREEHILRTSKTDCWGEYLDLIYRK